MGLLFPCPEMANIKSPPKKRWIFVKYGPLSGKKEIQVTLDFLGGDGLALLHSLAGRIPSAAPVGPPRLVVYPQGGRWPASSTFCQGAPAIGTNKNMTTNLRILRTWVIVDGAWRKVDAIDRGELLLRSPQEWYKRYITWLHSTWRSGLLSMILSLLILVPLCWLADSLGLALALTAIAMIAYVLTIVQTRLSAARSFRRDGNVPGLYGLGFQIPDAPMVHRFIPFAEMIEVRPRPGLIFSSVWVVCQRGRIRIPRGLEFLGADGLALLQSLAGRSPPVAPASPPRLIVYPAADR